MTALRTRSLLAVVLVLGQLAGLRHGLEHTGRHDGAGRLIAMDHAHHPFEAHPHVHRPALVGPAVPVADGVEHDDALCGICLIAAGGVTLPGTAPGTRTDGSARDLPSDVRGEPPPERRMHHRSARAPPPILS